MGKQAIEGKGCVGLVVLLVGLLLGIRWLVGIVAGFLKGIMLIGFVMVLLLVAVAILLLYNQFSERLAERKRREQVAGDIVQAVGERTPPTSPPVEPPTA